jgi:hypothetical protein
MKSMYLLRDQFSIKFENETVVGPCQVELSDEEAIANAHKIEEVPGSIPPENALSGLTAVQSDKSEPKKAKAKE